MAKYEFFKKNETDKVWWVHNYETKGEMLISFDKKQIFNLSLDYPDNLTTDQVELFDKENPNWAKRLSYKKQ